MKITIVSILMIFFVSCSGKEPTSEFNQMNVNKNMPTPKSQATTKKPNDNEALAPQTCYYGCKARR